MRTGTGAAAALILALGAASGCNYAFRNPAEALAAGEVSGRTTAGTSVVIDGVSVAVKNAGLAGVSRQNGAFTILPLPVGRHTLLFRKGTDRALQREVEIALGKDGQPQGVWLGDVAIPAAVTLAGTVRLPAVGGLAARLGPGGVAVDEESGTLVPIALDGSYALSGLAVGAHHLRFYATDDTGREFVGGPLALTLGPADAGTRKTVSRVELHPAVPVATLAATVTFQVAVAGDVPGLSLPSLRLSGLPAPAAVDASGRVQVNLREGLWTVGVALPANVGAASPPPTVTFAAVAGEVIDLGTLLVVSDAAQQRAERACHTDADCAPADRCLASGVCGPEWAPPVGAPASVPVCAGATRGCIVGQPVVGSGPFVTTTCVGTGQVGYPLACGACCTPDGQATFCALPGQGGCPVLKPSGGGTGHVVSGTISGAGSAGTRVILTDEISLVLQATTGDGGAFAFADVPDGSYLVAPSSQTVTFEPPFRNVTVAGADVTAVDFIGTALPAATITATIVDAGTGAAHPGVTVTATGYGLGASQTAISDATGAVTFSGLQGLTYTVTPAATGLVFTPPSSTFVLGQSIGVGFSAAPLLAGTHRLSGTFTYQGGAYVPLGAAIAILGPSADTIIDVAVDGTFFLDGLADGNYDLSPQVAGFAITPAALQVTLAGADLAGLDFDIHLPTLSGRVTLGGAPLAGVSLSLTDSVGSPVGTAVSGATGDYSFGALPLGYYSVTPVLSGYTFSPPSVQQFLLSGNTTIDFAATQGGGAFAISGRLGGLVSSGQVMALSGAGLPTPLQVTTGALGDYAFTGLAAGTYTVQPPTTAGLAWSPALATFTVGPDVTTADFVAWPAACVDCGLRWSWPLPQGNALNALWGSSAADVWAVGDRGATLHYGGNSWAPSFNATSANLRGVWGSAASDVWAVGDGGAITYYNGTFWSGVTSPTTANLTAVWGSAANDVWAVGAGVILHASSGTWATSRTGTEQLQAVWGESASSVWAAGTDPASGQGVFLHYTPAAGWTVAQNVAEPITALWGTGAADAWAAGSAGGTYRLSAVAGTWSAAPAGAETASLRTGWSFGTSDVWTAGGPSVQHWTGTGWAVAHPPGAFGVNALWGSSATDLWAVGQGGAIFHFTGAWAASNGATANPSSLQAVWAASAADAWAAGAGNLLRWDGITWTPSTPPGQEAMNGLWGSSATDVWMVGQLGDTVYHWTGATWSPVTVPNAPSRPLLAVAGSGPGDVWAVGIGGTILRYGGSAWTSSVSPTTGDLTGLWVRSPTDAWAVGPTDMLRWNGATWSAVPVPFDFAPAAVWGTSAGAAWCVGSYVSAGLGTVIGWDGNAWSAPQASFARPLRAIGGSGPTEVFAVGDGGLLVMNGGSGFATTSFATGSDLKAVAAGAPTAVFLVGSDNTILRYGF